MEQKKEKEKALLQRTSLITMAARPSKRSRVMDDADDDDDSSFTFKYNEEGVVPPYSSASS